MLSKLNYLDKRKDCILYWKITFYFNIITIVTEPVKIMRELNGWTMIKLCFPFDWI